MAAIDKFAIRQAIIQALEADRQIAEAVLQASHDAATHAESKAENKYDTRGLEAAYLADGQRRRLHEIDSALAAYRKLPVQSQAGGVIRLGALLSLNNGGGERWFFLGPDAAGLKVRCGGQEIFVISPRSPLGQGLLGKEPGDEVQLRVAGQPQRYEIVEVW